MFKYVIIFICFLHISLFANQSILTEINTEFGKKPIALQVINDSRFKAKQQNVNWFVEKDYSKGIVDFSKSPSAVVLSPNVPILDQGQYGTCVTFAATMAVNAVLKLGDGISQQCSLMLTELLGNPIWDGAYRPSEVLDPLKTYGAVRQYGCGYYYYPDRYSRISYEEYLSYVDPYIDMSKVNYVFYEKMSVEQLKVSVNQGKYVAFGFGLLANGDAKSVQGFDVVVSGVKKVGGLWACRQRSSFTDYCSAVQAGHEVVVVGYDDKQKLLKIQNSWGSTSGDSGYYYMTYEFFNAMQFDATEIWAQ